MAPAVPFALVGVVQLTAVAVWLGLATATCFPRLRRPATPLLALGSLGMAAAEAVTALRLDVAASEPLGVLRLVALLLVAAGIGFGGVSMRSMPLSGVVVPLGAPLGTALLGAAAGATAALASLVRGRRTGQDRQATAGLALGLLFTALATGLAGGASDHLAAALALLSARAAASVCFAVVLIALARTNLLGKVVGAIVAGVVVMAVGAVAIVGVGVADQVQQDQSQRLLSVAMAQQQSLDGLATRAGLFAQIVSECPSDRSSCIRVLRLFSADPNFFAVIDRPGHGASIVAPGSAALSPAALSQLVASTVVRGALRPSATSRTVASGAMLLPGNPSRLVIVAAVPGRPSGSADDSRVPPTFAAVYGIGLVDSYLQSVAAQTGYNLSVLAGGRVLASNLSSAAQARVLSVAQRQPAGTTGVAATTVVAAQGQLPTVALMPVTRAGDGAVRVATLAVSQGADTALAAQRSVLRRLVLTALVVLALVAAASIVMAQRIVEPLQRLTIGAGRVRRGDLNASVDVNSRDEVGSLGRAFDAMTSSLRGLTGDLRKAAEQEAALRVRLQTVVASMTDGLLTTDPDGRVTTANSRALDLLGWAESDLIGLTLAQVVDVRDAGGIRLLTGESRVDADAVLHRGDGTELPVRVAVAPLEDGGGRVVLLADRTREREVERMKTEFLANISHELRSPLTPIRGYAELLARNPHLSSARAQEFLGEILAATARMSRAVDLLVDVAALEAGRIVPVRRTVPVGSLVDERLAAWKARYPDRAPDLRRRVQAGLPDLEVDAFWLHKALDELMDNAVKYSPPGSQITIDARAVNDGAVRLAVRDNGPGVDTARLAELLGDFAQADGSETRVSGGMGLGLGFVSRVAEPLGLTVRVRSRVGDGSEFALEVPTGEPDRE
jgi:PAS domain S-box-containing protein